MDRFVDKRREFGCPVGHEGSGARRHPDAVDERVDSLNQMSREVAYLHSGRSAVEFVGKAASEYEGFAVEQSAAGVMVEVVGHGFGSAAVVVEAQGVVGDGDVFAFAVGCA